MKDRLSKLTNMKRFIILALTTLSLSAAEVNLGDLTLATAPSDDTMIMLRDPNSASPFTRRYALTNLLSVANAVSTYAPLASPALTGTPTAPTASANDSDTSIATTAYVQGELTAYASDTATFSNKTLDAGSNSFTSWPEVLIIAASDESTAITTGTNKITFRFPYALTLTGIRASVGTAPTGSTIIIDVNESGTTIFSTKLTIDAGEETSTTAATAAVISDTAIADDAEITIDFDQVGSSTAGAGVKITFYGTRTI